MSPPLRPDQTRGSRVPLLDSRSRAEELLAASAEQGLEGLVLKRLDSPYVPGKRTGAWLKVKNVGRQELTAEGMVRHGSFKGLREDKPAEQVGLERPDR